ncbi:MAG TPA: pseudouridine synthase, partial [Thermoanaerobaculia bacterium]|nr:pseudouridine synthase [Thermoanaerobaculia bacterium]
VEGKRIQPVREHRYLLLNKPKEVMSAVSDPQERRTVMDFVPPAMRKALVPVGRLDYHTEGLLLLTDDGEFAQRIAHPRYGSTKTYEVKVKGTPSEAMIDKLRAGITIDGKRTAPAKIAARNPHKPTGSRRRGEPESENSWWVVELTEGRTRQIREMFFRIGNPVQKLRRVAIGPLRDPRLPLGALRELTEQEVRKLLNSARGPEERPARKKAAPRPAGEKAPAAKKPAARRSAAKKTVPVRKGARKAPARKAAPAKKGGPARKAAPRAAPRSGPQGRR